MSDIKKLTCINCPIGCSLSVEMNGSEIVKISGNSCMRGEIYARNEVTAPVRVVTSSVRLLGGEKNVVSVKTAQPVPKQKIFDCLNAMKDLTVTAPVTIGDVVISNIADTGVDLVASANANAV